MNAHVSRSVQAEEVLCWSEYKGADAPDYMDLKLFRKEYVWLQQDGNLAECQCPQSQALKKAQVAFFRVNKQAKVMSHKSVANLICEILSAGKYDVCSKAYKSAQAVVDATQDLRDLAEDIH